MKIHSLKNLRKYFFFTILALFSIALTTQFNTRIKTLSLETLNTLEDIAYAAQIASPEACEVEVVVQQDDKETIIVDKYALNYPEGAFVAVIPIEKCYDENDNLISKEVASVDHLAKLKIKGRMPKELPFELVNITGSGYTGDDSWALNWGGLYIAMDEEPSLVNWNSLYRGSNGYPAPNNAEINLDLTKGINVIAVKSWSYKEDNPDISFEVEVTDPSSSSPTIANSGEIKVNIDNVDFVRANLQGSNLDDLIPPAGDHYTGNPGLFGVLENSCVGTYRPYSQIKQILTDAQRNGHCYPPSGNGLDWLQLAATNIYNENHTSDLSGDVFKCVWEVTARVPPNANFSGEILPEIPYRVYLNPYSSNKKLPGLTRFNLGPNISKYGFTAKKWRDTVIWHEPLHSYQFLPGEGVDDEEDPSKRRNDDLHVDINGTMNPYLTFSYDNKPERGFVNPDLQKADPVKAIEESKFVGDKGGIYYRHNRSFPGAYFISEIQLTPEEQRKVFVEGKSIDRLIETPVPKDLPHMYFKTMVFSPPPGDPEPAYHWVFNFGGMALFLCNSNGSCQYLNVDLEAKEKNTISSNQGKKESAFGYYIPQTYFYEIVRGYEYEKGKNPAREEIITLINHSDPKKRSKLKAVIGMKYPHEPQELDADYFSNIERGLRTWFP